MFVQRAVLVSAILIASLLPSGLVSCAPDEAASRQSSKWTPQLGRPPRAGDEYTYPKDGSVLVWIPGGEFTMGSDKGDEDEKPPHKITVKGFWLGKYEVTNKQFGPFFELGEVPEPLHWEEKGYNDANQPIIGLIWETATSYCKWAGLRLPTEAEWEYVGAVGAKQFEYPTATGAISHDLANFRGVGGRDRWEGPAPVGSFPPNPLGLFDMAGNAWEFTCSIWKPYPYEGKDRENFDPDNREMMVLRGGSWGFSEQYCRTARRRRFASHLCYDFAGFRVALDGETTTATGSTKPAAKGK